MHVQYVAICEQVVLGTDGKPSLIGVFNDHLAPAIPAVIPRLAVVARLLFTADEAGSKRTIELVIKDPTGAEMGRPNGEMTLPPMPPGADSLAVDLPLQFDLFQLPAFGRYTFLLHVDGAPAAGVQLSVRQGGPPPMA